MKLLIFKFMKNDKNEKKKLEEQEEMMMTDYAHIDREKDHEFD